MTRTTSFLALFAGLGLAGTAQAQSAGFDVDGHLTVSYISYDDGSSETFYTGLLDASFPLTSAGAGQIGFDLSADLLGDFEDFDWNNYYYALTYSGNFGKIAVGTPRSAYDQYRIRQDGAAAATPTEASLILGSTLRFLMVEEDVTAIGAAYTGMAGGAEFGLSYHRIEVGADSADYVGYGARYPLGNMSILLAGESFSGTGGELSRTEIGVESQSGALGYGASVGFGDYLFLENTTVVQAYVSYDVTDRIGVIGDVLYLVEGGDSFTVLGLSADYEVVDNFAIGLDYTHSSSSSSSSTDQTIGLSATYSF